MGPSGSPLRAAEAPPAGPSPPPLTSAELQPLVAEAIARWEAAGLTPAQLDALRSAPVMVADLGGDLLGLASGATVWIDADAAGWGWFVDATPWDDSELGRLAGQPSITAPGTRGHRRPSLPPHGGRPALLHAPPTRDSS